MKMSKFLFKFVRAIMKRRVRRNVAIITVWLDLQLFRHQMSLIIIGSIRGLDTFEFYFENLKKTLKIFKNLQNCSKKLKKFRNCQQKKHKIFIKYFPKY
jgi:hypothetical protein